MELRVFRERGDTFQLVGSISFSRGDMSFAYDAGYLDVRDSAAQFLRDAIHAWQPASARAIMNAWMPYSREGDVRIYSEAEMRRILGTWFSEVAWRRVGITACLAVARKGV